MPNEDEDNLDEIEEDLTQRLVHYDAIKKLGKKIFELPQDKKDFFIIKIRNEFLISNKIVPKLTLQDLILKFSIILKNQKTIKIISDETDLFSVEDGIKWLKNIFEKNEQDWFSLFDFLPSVKLRKKKKICSSILTSCIFKRSISRKNYY